MKNLSLCDFKAGKTVVVLKINEAEYILDRYLSLGIYEGIKLKIFLKSGRNIIVKAGNAKIAFMGNCASKIICSEIS